jgi:pimeloyl-ACP methyl ester carboxylesterase
MALCLAWSTGAATADAASEVTLGMTPDAYASAGELIRLQDDRTINLRCSGEGLPVVLLVAGGNADSTTWFRVQGSLADRTRVCAYDRAGYGFSSAGPLPRDLDAQVEELHALIGASGLALPVVLVGHSIGSSVVRAYAQRHAGQLAGMVLVDPPEQGADALLPAEWQQQIAPMLAQRDALLDACESAAAAGDLETIRGSCLRKPPVWVSSRVAAALEAYKARPDYWRTIRSEFEHSTLALSSPVPVDETYGSIPLVLLRPVSQDAEVPEEVRAVLATARMQTHARILAGSQQRVLVEVSGTSHDIQLDRPDAVVAAVRRLLEQCAQTRTQTRTAQTRTAIELPPCYRSE